MAAERVGAREAAAAREVEATARAETGVVESVAAVLVAAVRAVRTGTGRILQGM